MMKRKLIAHLQFMAGYESKRVNGLMKVIKQEGENAEGNEKLILCANAIGRAEAFEEIASLMGSRRTRKEVLRHSAAYASRSAPPAPAPASVA